MGYKIQTKKVAQKNQLQTKVTSQSINPLEFEKVGFKTI